MAINPLDLDIIIYSLLKLEMTSVCLILKKYLNKNGFLYKINLLIFYISFIKFRIIDFYYHIIYKSTLYEIINKYTPNNTIGSIMLLVSCYGLYILNIYWFLQINKIIYKKIFIKK